ncbi:MAG TPA: hypothetical protein VK158_00495 [Acidobacteriota bacterium]|nr:hypothetical protein [Acidobacteriota bacterium]
MKGFEHKHHTQCSIQQNHKTVVLPQLFMHELRENIDIILGKFSTHDNPYCVGLKADTLDTRCLHMNLYQVDPSIYTSIDDPSHPVAMRAFVQYIKEQGFAPASGQHRSYKTPLHLMTKQMQKVRPNELLLYANPKGSYSVAFRGPL